MKYSYFCNCVGWDRKAIDELHSMIDGALDISRETFLKHVDREEIREIELNLGYSLNSKNGLTMKNDWHVSYHRSKVFGKRCYFFKHSGIEYVFTQPA